MLNIMQRDIIRTGYRAAEKTGDEKVIRARVRQLAKDFGFGEDEVYKIVRSSAGTASSADPISAAQKFAAHRGRREWTEEEIQKLKDLRAQHKGPKEIAGVLHCDVNRVQAKLHALKKVEAQAQPTAEPIRAGAASASEPEKKASVPETRARDEKAEKGIPAAEPAPAPAVEPAPPNIHLARLVLDQLDQFAAEYAARPGRLQADESAGWATGSFEAGGSHYSISLRRRKIH